jgi:replication factor C subunit 1
MIGASYQTLALSTWLKTWNTPQRQFRGAMISGPTGIGKTLLADLVCAEAGMPNVLRVDSSRKRTKKALADVEEAFSSRKIDAYLTGRMQRSKPGAVIIDELDAMVTGSVDAGGISRILEFVRGSRIPVICICNDPGNRSLKALVAQCMHVRMQRPTVEAISRMLLEVAAGEGLTGISQCVARDIAERCGCDVRQSLNEMQFCSTGTASSCESRLDGIGLVVDRAVNPFDAAAAMFGCHPRDSVRLAVRLYESDPVLGPLLIHENYLKSAAELDPGALCDISEALSTGDLVEAAGRRGHVMVEVRAAVGCAFPCALVGSKLDGRLEFPAFLGRCGTASKNRRLLTEISRRMRATAFATETLPALSKLLVAPMAAPGGAVKVAAAMRSLGLLRADWDVIAEIGTMMSASGPKVTAVTKAALTREMTKLVGDRKKRARGSSSSASSNKRSEKAPPSKRRTSVVPKEEIIIEEEKEEEEEEEERWGF